MPENPYQPPNTPGSPMQPQGWYRIARLLVGLLLIFALNVAAALIIFAIGVKLMFFNE